MRQKIITSNPLCTLCNKKMKSKGKNQGFECLKCGKHSDAKTINVEKRKLKKDLYIPITSAHRHLTRPIQRIGRKNTKSSFDGSLSWFHRFGN